jgi:hypothetical protein
LSHNSAFHTGIYKSANYLLARFWRPGILGAPSLRVMLQKYINACTTCPKKKSLRLSHRFKLRFPVIPTKPNSQYSCDYLGPFPPSTETVLVDEHNRKTGRIFKYVLVFVDNYSGFTHLFPTEHATAGSAVACIKDIVRNFSVFDTILSDNGSHFTARYFIQSCAQLGLRIKKLLPSSPWSNKCERQNLCIADCLRVVNTDDVPWHTYLPFMQLHLNSAFHRSINTSPFLVQMGRNPRLPVDLIVPEPVIKPTYRYKYNAPEDHARKLQELMIKINNTCSPKIIKEKYASHQYHNSKIPEDREIRVGDIVMMKLKLKPDVSPKLTSEWIGYFVVIDTTDTKCTVQTLGGRKTYNQHMNLVLRVQPTFEQDFAFWNSRMLEYTEQLKQIEVKPQTQLNLPKTVFDNDSQQPTENHSVERSFHKEGYRSNIYKNKTKNDRPDDTNLSEILITNTADPKNISPEPADEIRSSTLMNNINNIPVADNLPQQISSINNHHLTMSSDIDELKHKCEYDSTSDSILTKYFTQLQNIKNYIPYIPC